MFGKSVCVCVCVCVCVSTHTQVYITMSKEEKKEGKAAVDLLGSYFGKSGASWIMQVDWPSTHEHACVDAQTPKRGFAPSYAGQEGRQMMYRHADEGRAL